MHRDTACDETMAVKCHSNQSAFMKPHSHAAKAAGVDDADYCATVAEVVSSQMNARSQVDINEIQNQR